MKTLLLALTLFTLPVFASGDVEIEHHTWPFDGMMTQWDKDRLYRGYTVATNVCMSCHSFKYISHRTLLDKGGFTEAEAKTLAAELNMKLDDKFISGLDTDSAKELYGKEVPDLSLMNKARAGLANYVYAVLTGYSEDPEEIHHALPDGVPDGAYFNSAFPGHAIAMPAPLSADGLVDYHDDTEATIDHMAQDVVYFMQWTAEPELIHRNSLGVYTLLYVLIFTILAYLLKKAVWRGVKH